MWGGVGCRPANRCKFFRSELEQLISVDSLYQEAYILVNRGNFTFRDVKEMTRLERVMFLNLIKDQIKRETDAIKRN